MKNSKVLLFAALALCLAACNQPAPTEQEAVATEVVEETFVPQENKTAEVSEENAAGQTFEQEDGSAEETSKTPNMGDIQALFSECQEDNDCAVVFPSCCKEANQPYFVNKQYEQDLIKEYKRITGEPEVCPEFSNCPRSYFGGEKASCISGKCMQSISQ